MRVGYLLRLISQHLDEHSQYDTDNVMQVLHKYTLRKLYDLLYNITQHNNYELNNFYIQRQLQYFLADFYDIVKDTDALPLHSPNTSLSQIMMHIALILEGFSQTRSRFEFLLPSVKVSNYMISGTLLRDPGLKLNDFVMSDDHTCLIEVFNCLKLASEDGILKHTCLFDGKVKTLSSNEEQRVINHSKEAKEYWEAIQDKIQITLHGNSFGAVLMRLANDLYNGGINAYRDGKEEDSGVNANVGILNFFLWHDKLTEAEKNYLDQQRFERTSLKTLILRLKRPEDTNYLDFIYCVHIISDDIKYILEKNPDLYNKYPQNTKAETIRIELAEAAVTNAEYRLTEAPKNPNYRVTATYYGIKSPALLFDNLSRLPDLKVYVSSASIKKMYQQKQNRSGCLISRKRDAISPDPERRVRRQRTRYTQS